MLDATATKQQLSTCQQRLQESDMAIPLRTSFAVSRLGNQQKLSPER